MMLASMYMSAFLYLVTWPCKAWWEGGFFAPCVGGKQWGLKESVQQKQLQLEGIRDGYTHVAEVTLVSLLCWSQSSACAFLCVHGVLWKPFCDLQRQLLYGRSGPGVSEINLNRCIARCFCLVLKLWESGVLGMHLCTGSSGMGGTVLLLIHSEVVLSLLA